MRMKKTGGMSRPTAALGYVTQRRTMNDEIFIAIGILASVLGLFEFTRRMIIKSHNETHRVKVMLEEIEELKNKLDDVHKDGEYIKAGIDRLEKELYKITYD